ncbi:MAG TPA: tripartite tricarboxylate transporter substrate binding protein [Ramlibacter sp.]|nr:tripartite tricarboxylate transporter substrate binding protein [Ramlibacter sp.]
MHRIQKVLLTALSVSALAFGPAASAFPDKEITILVGFTAGGLADIGARTWADAASPILGKRVVVVNRPGAGGVIAANEAARAAPDGYTLSFFTPGPFVVQPHFEDLQYKVPDSFVPIISQYINPIIVAAPADAPYNNLKELVAFAKQNPDKLRYSSSSLTGVERFAMERLQQAAGIRLEIIPFKSSGDATSALIGKHVELTSAYFPDLKRHFDAKTLKPIASLGFERSDLPVTTIPTAREDGFEVVGVTYSGLLAPRGTPKAVVDRLHDAFRQAQETPQFKQAMERVGMKVRYMNGADFQAFIKREYDDNGATIRKLGLK